VAGGLAEIRPLPGTTAQWLLTVDGIGQSEVDLEDPGRLGFEYMRWIAAALDAAVAGPLHAVHIGAGLGALPGWVAATRPGSHQVVLDPDAALLAAARDTVGLRSRPGLRIRPEDGRAGLAGLRTGAYRAVVRDAFDGRSVPPHLATAGFVSEVARVLAPDGLYVANLGDRRPFPVLSCEVATARTAFPHVLAMTEPAVVRGRRAGNVVVVASRRRLDDAAGTLVRVLAGEARPARVLAGEALRSRITRTDALQDGQRPPDSPAQPDWS
jgi:spermidine synthase